MSTGTILITGASSGLGAEMARQFAALGYDLALAARRLDRLEELRAQILAAHPDRRIEVRQLDVLDDDAVFAVTHEVAETFGRLDRVIVNAGLGKGAPLGKGRFAANRETVMVNFVAALAQIEAAMEVFRDQKGGHLVAISSVSAHRGMKRNLTAYAASKAGIAALAEGLQNENVPGVDVTILYPGFIESEMTARTEEKSKLMASTEDGVRAMVKAIEKRVDKANVPAWPYAPLGAVMKHAPMPVVRKLM